MKYSFVFGSTLSIVKTFSPTYVTVVYVSEKGHDNLISPEINYTGNNEDCKNCMICNYNIVFTFLLPG